MLSDCIKCWETPCSCGWDYRHKNEQQFADFIFDILGYRTVEEKKRIFEIVKQKMESNA